MLVQFKIENFLSFKDSTTFSMVGYTPIKEHEGDEQMCSVFYDTTERVKLLKSSVLYGANGSGKSNLLSAMSFFRTFILNSSNERQADDEIPVLRFLLSTESDGEPSSFEMIFFINDIRYRYGFEVDTERVHSEWLFELKGESSLRETTLFTREFQQIKPNKQLFKEGKGLEDKTRPNALFLSTVAQLNGEISTNMLKWFKLNFNIISGLEDTTTSYTVSKFLKDDTFKNLVISFFKSIQIGFEDIEIMEEGSVLDTQRKMPSELESALSALKKLQDKTPKTDQNGETKQVSIQTLHKKFNTTNDFVQYEVIDFGLESKGTKKLFSLLGPIIDTIQNGKILIIDELDSRLHTLLTMELIKFFHAKTNLKAQLIFASHDTNLLRKDIFRRDQIWFAEKNAVGATDLYSLVEYKINQATVRNDASFEKDYLIGKYGAIPFLSNIHKFKLDFLYEQQAQEK
jgi:uncharacterized protein